MISRGNVTNLGTTTGNTFGNHNNDGNYVVMFVWDRNGGSSGYAFVGYGGVPAVVLGTVSNGFSQVTIYGVPYPASGVNQATLIRSGGFSLEDGMIVASYLVANPAQPDSVNSGSSGTSTMTINTTVVGSNCWLLSIGEVVRNPGAAAISQNRTSIGTLSFSSGSLTSEVVVSDSNGTVGTGSQGTIFTFTGSTAAAVVASLSPFPPPASSTNFLLASY